MKYCSRCGAYVTFQIPPGDDRRRFFCNRCNTVHYQNPKMVVGCIPEWGDSILMCRRAIEPRHGKWTLPAGYLENGETVSEAAQREAYEEARARLANLKPFGLFNLTFVNEVYLMFRADLKDGDFKPGEESLEVQLMREDEVPWDHIAFPVMGETLVRYFKDRKRNHFPFHLGNILQRG